MGDRFECCGDQDCSCAQCTVVSIPVKDVKSTWRVVVETGLVATGICLTVLFIFWIVVGFSAVSAWLDAPFIGEFKQWTLVAVLYVIFVAANVSSALKDHLK